MSFILADKNDNDNEIQINNWNWKTILMILDSLKLLDTDRIQMLGFNGTSESVSKQEAEQISKKIRDEIISKLNDDERILLNGKITNIPDDGTFYKNPDEYYKNFSTNKVILEKFCTFCESCNGFEIF